MVVFKFDQNDIVRHLQLAIRNNEELNKPVAVVTIAQGDVLPNLQAVLLSKKTEKSAKAYFFVDAKA